MNFRMITYVLGRILLTEGALMALPLVTGLLYGESALPFLISITAKPGQLRLASMESIITKASPLSGMCMLGLS